MIESTRSKVDSLAVLPFFGHGLLWLFTGLFFSIGWVVGMAMRGVLWAVSAIVAGYEDGKGSQ